MAEIDLKFPRTILRANMPVKVGNDLLLSGEVKIGSGTRVILAASMPMEEAERQWSRIRGIATSYPTIPHLSRAKRPELDIGDIFDPENTGALDIEAEGFFDDAMKFISKSPIASTAKNLVTLIPGVGPLAHSAFMAADLVKMAQKALPPGMKLDPKTIAKQAFNLLQGKNTQRRAKGKKALPVGQRDVHRAASALHVLNAAKQGNRNAIAALGKMRLIPTQPTSDEYRDNMALDAAQFADEESSFSDDFADELEGLNNDPEVADGVSIGDWRRYVPEIGNARDLELALRKGRR